MTPFVPGLLAKLTLILGFGLVAAAIMRASSPSLRHLVLLATLGTSLALPAVMLTSPEWKVQVLAPPAVASSPVATQPTPGPVVLDPVAATPRSLPSERQTEPPGAIGRVTDPAQFSAGSAGILDRIPIIAIVWLVGVLALLFWLAIGRIRLNHIASKAWPLFDGDWSRILDEERRSAGVTKQVHLLSSPAVSTPLTWGWWSPIVLLPEDALDWTETHRRIVLRHELAHVARADSLSQLVAGFACALYWFHPMVWMVERRMRAECERACDDTVVAHGTPPAEYAAHLLEVARSARAFGAPGFLSVAMARPSQLEGRLLAVLNESRQRVGLARGAGVIAALLTGILLIPLAAFRPVPRKVATVNVIPSSENVAPVKKTVSAVVNGSVPKNTMIPVPTAPASADTTFQLSTPTKSGGTLVLDLSTGGKVVINSWDRAEVMVKAALGGRDWRRTRVSLTPVGEGARLESFYTGTGNSQSSSHLFEITVPRNYDVRLSSAGGSISITGLNGTFTGHTGGGQINIANSSGEAQLKTGGGQIHVVDSRLNGTVSTGGGTVRIERVTGDFNGYSGGGPVIVSNGPSVSVSSSGGGSVIGVGGREGASAATVATGTRSSVSTTTYVNDRVRSAKTIDSTGGIRISSAGGALSLPTAPDGARVTTGGGGIRIGASGGRVYASTGGGPIDIGPARGSVEAHTGAGDVTIELEGAAGHSVDVTSGNGQVVLVVPRDLDAVLELESAYTNNLGHRTRIVSDMPLQITETSDWDDRQGTPRRYVRARQTVGRGGSVIRIRTVNGDVILRQQP